MPETNKTDQNFEWLVMQVLDAHGYAPSLSDYLADTGFDLFGNRRGRKWIAQVKFYRSPVAQLSMIRRAAIRVAEAALRYENNLGILVVSCNIPYAARQEIEHGVGILIFDRSRLLALAATAGLPKVFDALTAMLEVQPEDLIDGLQYDVTSSEFDAVFETPFEASAPPPEKDSAGGDLASELSRLDRGRSSATQYEQLCERILQYLFPGDLESWHRQHRTDDGLNRFDLICRIRRRGEFWKFLTDHLDSRYILFEFKNYSGPIDQGQILTTEKYLLERGLRRVALIMTREGASESAHKAAQGAMREHGKLILIVDDKTVTEMLNLRQSGGDPSDRLFDIADQFLLTLPR